MSKWKNLLKWVVLLQISTGFVYADDLYWLTEPSLSVGLLADNETDEVKISNNGRYIVFVSKASNLVANDNNFIEDVFIRDMQTGVTELVSVTQGGIQASRGPILGISNPTSDGRYVAFATDAAEFPGADGINRHLYIKDMVTGELTNESEYDVGKSLDFSFTSIYLSDDGLSVIFASATNIDPLHDNNRSQLYLKDLSNDSFQLLTTSLDGLSEANGTNKLADVSSNERYVLMKSLATNLTNKDINNFGENFVILDLQDNSRTLVNITPSGDSSSEINTSGSGGSISNSAQVVFRSGQSDLVANDTNDRYDVFLYDSGVVTRINLDAAGNELVDSSDYNDVTISDNGNRVAFTEKSDELFPSSINNYYDLYAYETATGTLSLVSQNAGGFKVNGDSFAPQLSANGNRLVFLSYATDLTTDPAFVLHRSIFHYHFNSDTMTNEHVAFSTPQTMVDDATSVRMSQDQKIVVYASRSPNIVPEPFNSSLDLYLLDRNTQIHNRIAANIGSDKHDVSPSGRYITFRSMYLPPEGLISAGDYYVFRYDRQANDFLQIAQGTTSRVTDNGTVVFHSYENLDVNDTNDLQDVYAYNPVSQQVTLVSEELNGDAASTFDFDIGGDNGEVWVTFLSNNNNIVANDTGSTDVFLKKLDIGEEIIRVTELADGTGANGSSFNPVISTDGNWVAFITSAENLTNDDLTDAHHNQAYLYNRLTQEFTLVSLNQAGLPLTEFGTIEIDSVDVSDHGRFVVFSFLDQNNNTGLLGTSSLEYENDIDFELDVVLIDTLNFSRQIISRFVDGTESYDDVFDDMQITEDLSANPPMLGAVFMAGRGELTGLSGHPGHYEAYLFQKEILDPDIIFINDFEQ